MRRRAWNYGYLRSNRGYYVVNSPGCVEIIPVTAGYYYVPRYDRVVVYAPPRPGFGIGAAMVIGGVFAAWGLGALAFWLAHTRGVRGQQPVRPHLEGNRMTHVHPCAAERFRDQRRFEGQAQQ